MLVSLCRCWKTTSRNGGINRLPDQARDQNIRRILVATKYRFIGDTLLAVPLLRSIAERWPEAEITLLTGASAQELLKGCPYVQHSICFDPYRREDEGFRRFARAVREVRQERFDIAFVCNRSFHSALITKLAGVPERIGWSGFQSRDFLLTRTVPYNDKAPEIHSYLELLSSPFPDQRSAEPSDALELWVSETERRTAAAKLPDWSGCRVFGLQPGAKHAEKRWPVAMYAEVISSLAKDYSDAKFVLLGGPEEAGSADAVLKSSRATVPGRVVSAVGELTLRETLAALQKLDVFVAGDTAIRHAAMALGTPTVALFGPTSAQKWGQRNASAT